MSLVISVPSKSFFAGEYSALNGGPAITGRAQGDGLEASSLCVGKVGYGSACFDLHLQSRYSGRTLFGRPSHTGPVAWQVGR